MHGRGMVRVVSMFDIKIHLNGFFNFLFIWLSTCYLLFSLIFDSIAMTFHTIFGSNRVQFILSMQVAFEDQRAPAIGKGHSLKEFVPKDV
jgi:hypothetical protein